MKKKEIMYIALNCLYNECIPNDVPVTISYCNYDRMKNIIENYYLEHNLYFKFKKCDFQTVLNPYIISVETNLFDHTFYLIYEKDEYIHLYYTSVKDVSLKHKKLHKKSALNLLNRRPIYTIKNQRIAEKYMRKSTLYLDEDCFNLFMPIYNHFLQWLKINIVKKDKSRSVLALCRKCENQLMSEIQHFDEQQRLEQYYDELENDLKYM